MNRCTKVIGLLSAIIGLPWFCSCTTSATPPTPTHEAATIAGFVFRDLNANGIRDSREPGESGIVVSAYDGNNALVVSTTTDLKGDYVLNTALDSARIVKGESYVVIFSGLPDYLVSGPQGKDSGTEVQFVRGGANDVNYGVFNPDQYVAPKETP